MTIEYDLQMLSLYENEVKNSQLIIQHNPDLFSVDFVSQLDVSHLSIIKCVNLTSISSSALSHLTIEDCSLSTLDNINTPNIQSLGLSKNSLQLNALQQLNCSFRQLRILDISFNKKVDISFIDQNIQELNISGCEINIELLKTRLLTKLLCNWNGVKQITHLNAFRDLTELQLQANLITEVSTLQYLRQLKKLNVSYNKITSISALRPLKQLTYLDLSNNELTQADPLIDLKQLAKLHITGNKIRNFNLLQTHPNFKQFQVVGQYQLKKKDKIMFPKIKLTDVSTTVLIQIHTNRIKTKLHIQEMKIGIQQTLDLLYQRQNNFLNYISSIFDNTHGFQ
ncbi:GTP-binding_protein [Hexamita inflata]|uniref:GTP-binding protein n=1 Tax=Hexamita inflata TaxID=28002 RepID=A0AA86NTW8_9EUKA|nr:GTP-binding protein [Hexamita inflata]